MANTDVALPLTIRMSMVQKMQGYRPVANEEDVDVVDDQKYPSYRKTKSYLAWPAVISAILISNAVTLAGAYYCWNSPNTPRQSPIQGMFSIIPTLQARLRLTAFNEDVNQPRVHPLDTTWETFWWNTPYNSMENKTETDLLWDAIRPSHGLIALDREMAKGQNLPESMYLPDDHSKGVYLLESYHYLHCLVSRTSAHFDSPLENWRHAVQQPIQNNY